MKTRFAKPCPLPSLLPGDAESPVRRSERASAVVIFLALLAIMLVLVAANGRTLLLLKKDLRLIEQRQVQRLQRSQTNAVSLATAPSPTPRVVP
jgi:hypothetical protein